MHVATVTCRFDPGLGAFDDGPLRALTRDKVVVSVRDHFFIVGDLPHLAFVVVYRLVPPSALDGSSGKLDPLRGPPRHFVPRRCPALGDAVPRFAAAPVPVHAGAGPEPGRGRGATDDLRAGLAPDVRARFDLLRDWRNRTAQDEAVPAYAVLTNRQLVQVAALAPTTRAGLERVEGLGRRKADRYAAAILAVVTGQVPRGAPAAGPTKTASPTPPTPDPSGPPTPSAAPAMDAAPAPAPDESGSVAPGSAP